MTKVVERIRTQCSPSGKFHAIEIMADGSIRTPDCPHALDEAPKIATLVRLGKGHHGAWCGALVALYQYGVPDIVEQRDSQPGSGIGAWLQTYIRYETVKAIVRRMDDVTRVRDAPHVELFRQARHAFRRAGYLRDWKPADIDEVFHPYVRDPKLEIGSFASLGDEDVWKVPLSPTWLSDVHDLGIAVVSKRMVLGVSQEHPGFVYAIDRASRVVREFFYNPTTRSLGDVANYEGPP